MNESAPLTPQQSNSSDDDWPTVLDDAAALRSNTLTPLPSHSDESVRQALRSSQKLRVRSITWNQAAQSWPPPSVLRDQVFCTSTMDYFHAIAIGSQECENSIAKSLVCPSKKKWEHACRQALGSDYTMVHSHTLQATHLVVFVHRAILEFVSHVDSQGVPTGFGGVLGNKGGVAIALDVGQTSFCFLTAHLAHGQKREQKRVEDFHTICRSVTEELLLRRPQSSSTTQSSPLPKKKKRPCCDGCLSFWRIACRRCREPSHYNTLNPLPNAFDHVVFSGDLNFRIHGLDRPTVDNLLAARGGEGYTKLMGLDQLALALQTEPTFQQFREVAPVTFRPTYKFKKGSPVDVYDPSKKQRIPAWTDRILYAGKDDGMTLLSYASVPSIRTSDHKPVYASMECLVQISSAGGEEEEQDRQNSIV